MQQSYDATTHFESTVLDVLNMYTMITGKVMIRVFQSLIFVHFEFVRDNLYSLFTDTSFPLLLLQFWCSDDDLQ